MREIARVLYGSQNYGLDGPDSDRDYKVLMIPEFDDLYAGKVMDRGRLPEGCDPEHYSGMSVVKFCELLLKGNPNCVEMLYSVEWDVKDDWFNTWLDAMRKVYASGYVAIVWDRFYASLTGLALNAIDRNGVNAKTVSRARYILDMAVDIVRNGFVIDERTWRDKDADSRKWQGWARELRFQPPMQLYLDKMAADIREAMPAIKGNLSSDARAFCDGHRVKMSDVETVSVVLDVGLRDFVFLEIYEREFDGVTNRDLEAFAQEILRRRMEERANG